MNPTIITTLHLNKDIQYLRVYSLAMICPIIGQLFQSFGQGYTSAEELGIKKECTCFKDEVT
jgi:hypothetical protein